MIEAAGKRKAPEIKAKLTTWLEAQTANDKLGRYQFALMGGDHAGQRGSHLRAKGDGAVAFVNKVVKLSDDFLATFEGV